MNLLKKKQLFYNFEFIIMLEHLLFNKPNQDITITSYSEISDGTP